MKEFSKKEIKEIQRLIDHEVSLIFQVDFNGGINNKEAELLNKYRDAVLMELFKSSKENV